MPSSIPAVLYTLMFVKREEDFSLTEENIAQYRHIFSPDIRKRLLPDLQNALQADPPFDFRQHLVSKDNLTNEEIRGLVEKIYDFVKQHNEQLIR